VPGNADNFDISEVYHGQVAYGIYADLYKEITGKHVFTLGKYKYVGSYETLVQSKPDNFNRFEKGYSSIKPDCYIIGDCKKFVLNNFTVNKVHGEYVVSPYYVMSYCLYMSFHSPDVIWNMMFHGMDKMLECKDIRLLSMNSVGVEYWKDENYEFYTKNYESMVTERKPLDGVPPKNYLQYPNCVVKKIFDPSSSEFYGV